MNNDSGVIDKVLLSCIATLLFSDAIAQPASARCSSRVWVLPNKYFAKQMVFVQTDTLLADADVVYTSALLANAMKPLNVLPKFEDYFAIRTVRFQVQLEAGGYFSAQKFSSLQPQQTGRVGTALQFLNQIFQIQLQKRLLSFAQTRYSAHKLCRLRILTDTE